VFGINIALSKKSTFKKSLATFRLKPSTAIQSDDAKKLLFAIFLNASAISSTYFPATAVPAFCTQKFCYQVFILKTCRSHISNKQR